MAIESIKQRVNALPDLGSRQELQAALGAIVDALQALAAKLDADATVTDTNYAAKVAEFVID